MRRIKKGTSVENRRSMSKIYNWQGDSHQLSVLFPGGILELDSRARLAGVLPTHEHEHLFQRAVRRGDPPVEVALQQLHLLHEPHELHDEDLALLFQQLEAVPGDAELVLDREQRGFCRWNLVPRHEPCYLALFAGSAAASVG